MCSSIWATVSKTHISTTENPFNRNGFLFTPRLVPQASLTRPSVSWDWNGNQPSGTVGEVKAGEVSVTSHRGNEIKKTGDENDPAVHIERSGNDVVKKASELHIEEKASGNAASNEPEEEAKAGDANTEMNGANEETATEQNGNSKTDGAAEKEKGDAGDSKPEDEEPQVGEKRKADQQADVAENEVKEQAADTKAEEEQEPKKQKTEENASDDKAPPATDRKKSVSKKEKKVPAVGKTERKTRSQSSA